MLHLQQAKKTWKIADYLINPQTVYISAYVRSWEQQAKSCRMNLIDIDFSPLSAFKYTPGNTIKLQK